MMPFFDNEILSTLDFQNAIVCSNLESIIIEKRNALTDTISFYHGGTNNNNINNNSNNNNDNSNDNNDNNETLVFKCIRGLLRQNISITHNRCEMIVLITLISKKLYHSNIEIDRFVYFILLNQYFNYIFGIDVRRMNLMYRFLRKESKDILFIESLFISLINNNGTSSNSQNNISENSDSDSSSDDNNNFNNNKRNIKKSKQSNNNKVSKNPVTKKSIFKKKN